MRISDGIISALRKVVSTYDSANSFAKALGISPATLCRYTSGKTHHVDNALWSRLMEPIKEPMNRYLFGDRLASLMKLAKNTAVELMSKTGIADSDIGAFIMGTKIPSKSQYDAIAKALERELPSFDDLCEANCLPSTPVNMNVTLPYLRVVRELTELNQQELADLSGIHQRTISCYEASNRKPVLQYVKDLAAALSVTPDELRNGLLPGSIPRPVKIVSDDGLLNWMNKPMEPLSPDVRKSVRLMQRMSPEFRTYTAAMLRRIRFEETLHAELKAEPVDEARLIKLINKIDKWKDQLDPSQKGICIAVHGVKDFRLSLLDFLETKINLPEPVRQKVLRHLAGMRLENM